LCLERKKVPNLKSLYVLLPCIDFPCFLFTPWSKKFCRKVPPDASHINTLLLISFPSYCGSSPCGSCDRALLTLSDVNLFTWQLRLCIINIMSPSAPVCHSLPPQAAPHMFFLQIVKLFIYLTVNTLPVCLFYSLNINKEIRSDRKVRKL
jgi:hypothetical protein